MNAQKSFVREKRIICGQYIEVDLFEMQDMKAKGKKEKENKSSLKQIKQNDKNARRYFVQLVNTNFGENDFCVHCTYDKLHMPATIEDAEKNIRNYLRRIKNRRNKYKLEPMKYIIVTEYRQKEDGSPTRIHHHVIMDGMLEREEIEDLWRDARKKGEKKGKPLGVINVDRLQPDEYGLEALARYLTKGLTGHKRWHPSTNLKKPTVKKNDYKYSKYKLVQLAGMTDCPEVWKKLYPEYLLTEAKAVYTDERGWSISVKMRKDRYDKFYNTRNIAGTERICGSMPGTRKKGSGRKRRSPHSLQAGHDADKGKEH